MKIYKKQVHILAIKYKTKEKYRICAKGIFLSRMKILAMGANYGKNIQGTKQIRNRKKDIAELTDYFIQKYNAEHDTHVISIDTDVLQLFQTYDWPGNVRELEHIVERLCTINNNRTITMKSCGFLKELVQQSVHANADVPSSIASDQSSSHALWNANPADSAAQHDSTASAPTTGEVSWKDLSRKIQNTEKEAIIQALLQTNGNKAKAARLLNIDRSSLYYKLKKYNITE